VTSVVSVGVFDGLHLGHRQILERALARARERAARCVVVSFDPHPDVVLARPFQAVAPLTPHAERRELLTAMGVEIYEVIPFTRELAALEPEDFVDRYLIHPFGLSDLVVGANFALGRGRTGNVERLRRIGAGRGFEVEAVPLLEVDGALVSSTRIRALLGEGDVAGAARLLGRRYGLTGEVVTGEGIGQTLDCPTANLRLRDEKLLPADGIYAAWGRIEGESTWRPAALSLGTRRNVSPDRRPYAAGGVRGASAARPGFAAHSSDAPRWSVLATQPQVLHYLAVTLDLGALEIVEQPATLPHHAQQAPARRMIALVDLEVLGQVVNLFGEQRDLHLGRPRVAFVNLELADDALLLLFRERHPVPSCARCTRGGPGQRTHALAWPSLTRGQDAPSDRKATA